MNKIILFRDLGLKIFKENLKPDDPLEPCFLDRAISQILVQIEKERSFIYKIYLFYRNSLIMIQYFVQ